MARAQLSRPLTERILSKILKQDSCWVWTAHKSYQGYGQLTIGSRSDGSRRTKQAHIVSYEAFVGEVPEGFVLDHLCRNRACVRPDHLEPVTVAENIRRAVPYRDSKKYGVLNRNKTHCKNGHILDYVSPVGKRGCKTCRNITSREWKLARIGG